MLRAGFLTGKFIGILGWILLVGCGLNHSQPKANQAKILSESVPPSDLLVTSPTSDQKTNLDLLIKQREEATFTKLQNGVHKNKSIPELKNLSRVGKANETDFSQLFSSAVSEMAIITPENLKKDSYLEYKRIWYLADDAYKAIRSNQYQPELKLIPYLRREVPREQTVILHKIFSAELKRESLDPRALGAACSEMFKLTTIVEELKTL